MTSITPYKRTFPEILQQYADEIGIAIKENKHHDRRRQVFLEFLRKGFDVDPLEVQVEEKVKVAEVRGRIDALFKAVIFEFKTDLGSELPAAELELRKYFASRPRPQEYIGLVTDGVDFIAYQPGATRPIQFSKFRVSPTDPLGAFRYLDQFISSAKPTTPRSDDITTRFGLASAVFTKCRSLLQEMFQSVKEKPAVSVKYREWNTLLARVYGSRIGDETLFLKHTYLTMLLVSWWWERWRGKSVLTRIT